MFIPAMERNYVENFKLLIFMKQLARSCRAKSKCFPADLWKRVVHRGHGAINQSENQ